MWTTFLCQSLMVFVHIVEQENPNFLKVKKKVRKKKPKKGRIIIELKLK